MTTSSVKDLFLDHHGIRPDDNVVLSCHQGEPRPSTKKIGQGCYDDFVQCLDHVFKKSLPNVDIIIPLMSMIQHVPVDPAIAGSAQEKSKLEKTKTAFRILVAPVCPDMVSLGQVKKKVEQKTFTDTQHDVMLFFYEKMTAPSESFDVFDPQKETSISSMARVVGIPVSDRDYEDVVHSDTLYQDPGPVMPCEYPPTPDSRFHKMWKFLDLHHRRGPGGLDSNRVHDKDIFQVFSIISNALGSENKTPEGKLQNLLKMLKDIMWLDTNHDIWEERFVAPLELNAFLQCHLILSKVFPFAFTPLNNASSFVCNVMTLSGLRLFSKDRLAPNQDLLMMTDEMSFVSCKMDGSFYIPRYLGFVSEDLQQKHRLQICKVILHQVYHKSLENIQRLRGAEFPWEDIPNTYSSISFILLQERQLSAQRLEIPNVSKQYIQSLFMDQAVELVTGHLPHSEQEIAGARSSSKFNGCLDISSHMSVSRFNRLIHSVYSQLIFQEKRYVDMEFSHDLLTSIVGVGGRSIFSGTQQMPGCNTLLEHIIFREHQRNYSSLTDETQKDRLKEWNKITKQELCLPLVALFDTFCFTQESALEFRGYLKKLFNEGYTPQSSEPQQWKEDALRQLAKGPIVLFKLLVTCMDYYFCEKLKNDFDKLPKDRQVEVKEKNKFDVLKRFESIYCAKGGVGFLKRYLKFWLRVATPHMYLNYLEHFGLCGRDEMIMVVRPSNSFNSCELVHHMNKMITMPEKYADNPSNRDLIYKPVFALFDDMLSVDPEARVPTLKYKDPEKRKASYGLLTKMVTSFPPKMFVTVEPQDDYERLPCEKAFEFFKSPPAPRKKRRPQYDAVGVTEQIKKDPEFAKSLKKSLCDDDEILEVWDNIKPNEEGTSTSTAGGGGTGKNGKRKKNGPQIFH